MHNSVSKFNATGLSQSSQIVEAKKEDESIDTTVTVKHGGDMIVFHASENYRFNQLLDDACLYWQRTTAGGERCCVCMCVCVCFRELYVSILSPSPNISEGERERERERGRGREGEGEGEEEGYFATNQQNK